MKSEYYTPMLLVVCTTFSCLIARHLMHETTHGVSDHLNGMYAIVLLGYAFFSLLFGIKQWIDKNL